MRTTEYKRFLHWAALVSILLIACNIFYLHYDSWSGGMRHRAVPVTENTLHDKWIVITTVSPPTDDVKKLAALEGWKVVVVGDLKTPKDWNHTNCVYLSVDEQKRLGYRIASALGYNSYTRKMIGYLYAIQHGARYVYDTDDDNHPKSGALDFELGTNTSGLVYGAPSPSGTFNPYAHFGQPSIWPRGYPLRDVREQNGAIYTLCRFRTPAVQQGVVDGDPDVDAIFRLTRRPWGRQAVNVTFDSRAPSVTLARGIMAPFNSQNTMFSRDALWCLFLPITVAFRVTDIWRGYWAQRLLWLIGQRIAFFPPNAVQVRNPHDYLKDFTDETQMYADSSALVDFLLGWRCDRLAFFDCVADLGRRMADAGFWGQADADAIELWLDDLLSLGYPEPAMTSPEAPLGDDCYLDGPSNSVLFHAVRQDGSSDDDGGAGVALRPAVQNLHHYCESLWSQTLNQSVEQTRSVRSRYDGYVLVVVFNFPHEANVHLLDNLYHDHFANIVYCGQVDSFENLTSRVAAGPLEWRRRRVTYLNVTVAEGHLGYECAIRAIEMNYRRIDGYLVVSDDVLLNFWNLGRFSGRRPVRQDNELWQDFVDRHQNHTWHWWYKPRGAVPTNAAFEELRRLADDSSDERRPHVRRFFENRKDKGINDSLVQFGIADLYLVPAHAASVFAAVANVFLRHGVFLEIAVPTAFTGLTAERSEVFHGRILWSGTRRYTFLFFNATGDYLHPLKLAEATVWDKLRGEYCEQYVRAALQNW